MERSYGDLTRKYRFPALRTLIDYETAYDIVGTGMVSPVSMRDAILVVAEYGRFSDLKL